MTREEFIGEIEENLAGKIKADEIMDIVNDYNEYFDAGIRDGKSEEEICKEWGSPAKIVRTLLEEVRSDTSADRVLGIASSGQKHALDFASLPNRLIAFVIDTFIASLPLVFLLGPFAFFVTYTPLVTFSMMMYTSSSPNLQVERICGTLALAFLVLYPIISLLLLRGRTVGKLLMGIKVVRLDGSPLRLTDILARETLGKLFINGFSFGIASIISFIWSLVSDQHKTVHDAIGGTRVVNGLQSSKKEK